MATNMNKFLVWPVAKSYNTAVFCLQHKHVRTQTLLPTALTGYI